jgi:hypothetical protein
VVLTVGRVYSMRWLYLGTDRKGRRWVAYVGTGGSETLFCEEEPRGYELYAWYDCGEIDKCRHDRIRHENAKILWREGVR